MKKEVKHNMKIVEMIKENILLEERVKKILKGHKLVIVQYKIKVKISKIIIINHYFPQCLNLK